MSVVVPILILSHSLGNVAMFRSSLSIIVSLLLGIGTADAVEPISIEVQAGKVDRIGVPVSFELPKAFDAAKKVKLVQADNAKVIAAQIVTGTPAKLVWMIDEKLSAGSSRRYNLTAQEDTVAIVGVRMKDNGQDVLLAVGDKPVLRYQHAVMPSADPEQVYYARSGFIHPVYDPTKRMLTDAMPADHMHQHGLMFAYVKSTFEGRSIDFWNSGKREGDIRHVRFENRIDGPVFAGFTAHLEHRDLKAPGGPKVVLKETWEILVYNRTDGYLFDLKSTQVTAGDAKLTVNKNDYGGMCVRATSAWLEPGASDYLTGEGKTRLDGNHTRPVWCDITGKLDGKYAGITAFDHPSNFRYPQPVRLHPTKPYFCFAPMVLGAFDIEQGKPYVSTYRFFAHADKPNRATIQKLGEDYAEPVLVK